MSPEAEQRLREALHAARLIERATTSQTREGYLDDEWFQSAAQYQRERIGEAFTQAARVDPDVAAAIPEFRGWIGLRNLVAHAYRELQPKLIWDTITQEIPELAAILEQALESSGAPAARNEKGDS